DLALRRAGDQPVARLEHARPAIRIMALVGIVEEEGRTQRHHEGEVTDGDEDSDPTAGLAVRPTHAAIPISDGLVRLAGEWWAPGNRSAFAAARLRRDSLRALN